MKQLYLSLILSFSAFCVDAQVVITRSDFGNPGDTVYYLMDTSFHSGMTIGTGGTNKTWDYTTGVSADFHDRIIMYDASFNPQAPAGTNVIVNSDYNGETDYEINNTLARILISSPTGGDPLGVRIADFPMAYGKTFKDSLHIDTAFDASGFGVAGIDSAKMVANIVNDVRCDASGSLTIPMGTYDVVRLRNINTQSTKVYVKGTLTLGQWILFQDSTSKLYAYIYLTNNQKYYLAQATTDSIGTIQEMDIMESLAAYNGLNQLTQNDPAVRLWPNPAQGQINISVDNRQHEPLQISVADGLGRLVFFEETTGNSINADLGAFGNGFYFCTIRSKSFLIHRKFTLAH